jgi:DNA-binding CsgD family transcriptional regulator
MDHALGDFIARVNGADTLDTAWAATVDFLRAAGIEHVHYVYAPARGEESDVLLRRTTSPEWWLEHYAARRFATVDPGRAHCRRSSDVLLTGLDFAPPDADPHQIAFLAESRSLGIRNGIVVPLRLERDQRFGAFSCQTRFARNELERWFAAMGSSLQVALFYADWKHFELMTRVDATAIGLSPRERECLLWLAKGLRNDRIAERMGISNPTVEMHVAHARRKLNAATREQALAKAIALRLVSPL